MTKVTLAVALICLGLAGCVTQNPPPVQLHGAVLPAVPTDLARCFTKSFPDIPERDLNTGDVVRIIGQAKILDRAKAACGARAVRWMSEVKSSYGLGNK